VGAILPAIISCEQVKALEYLDNQRQHRKPDPGFYSIIGSHQASFEIIEKTGLSDISLVNLWA
jgi:hypothetical protein